ncbi:MAG: hypothetical protein SWI22_10980, partial [Pseudomonadota bacterium]|nr:hypothetical protein [Pseudomonadota bacterium]
MAQSFVEATQTVDVSHHQLILAGVVALETKFAASHRDHLTGLLDRRTFLARAGETLTHPG